MLSIIIITKNEEENLPVLLKSLKYQTYQNFEVIVSDADSTDRTRDIALDYGATLVKGGLPAEGRNNGAKVAKGKLLLFLDADVVLPSRFLEKNLPEFKRRKLGAATAIYKPISKKMIDKIIHKAYNIYAKGIQYFVPHAGGFCIFSRKDVFDRVGGFDENVYIAEDHVFVRATRKKKAKFRVLKGCPIFVSVRRMETEGRLKLVVKYLYCAFYMLFRSNIKNNIFKYDMGGDAHPKGRKKK